MRGRQFVYSLMFLSSILIYSCKESSIEVPAPPREVSMTVTGNLAGWNSGDGYSIIAAADVTTGSTTREEGVDTASIDINGQFSITLHSIYDKYATYPIVISEPGCDFNMNVSPYIMRTANIKFEIFRNGVLKGYITGIKHKVGNDTVGTYYVVYSGYSSAGTISGFKTCVNGDTTYTTYYEYEITTSYGWTKYFRKVVIKDTNMVAYRESNEDPQFGVVWEYSMK